MALDKSAAERLAALVIATGMLAVPSAAIAKEGTHQSADHFKVIDRTPIEIAQAGKMSSCGKCATQGSCGMSYHDKKRKQHSSAMVRKDPPKKRQSKTKR